MKYIPPRDIGKLPPGSYRVARKYDGLYAALSWSGGGPRLTGRNGAAMGWPPGQSVCPLPPGVNVPGELFALPRNGTRERAGEVPGAAPERLRWVAHSPFPGLPHCDYEDVHGAAGVQAAYDRWIASGAEGIVVHAPGGEIFKIKPILTLDAIIIGYSEQVGGGGVHDVLLGIVRPGGIQRLSCCGVGFDRAWLLEALRWSVCGSDYTETNSEHQPYRMIWPPAPVEIECTEILSERPDGTEIRKPVLLYEGGRWRAARKMPGVSLVFPRLLRGRDGEKTWRSCGISQILEQVAVRDADIDCSAPAPASEILWRCAWTKTVKNAIMVRKLVLARTNKTPDCPAYLIHHTDWSGNRKTPLERELFALANEEQALARFDALAAEIAACRGWEAT